MSVIRWRVRKQNRKLQPLIVFRFFRKCKKLVKNPIKIGVIEQANLIITKINKMATNPFCI